MAYDEMLAERIRDVLRDARGLETRKMFGGMAFMVGGHMCCGVVGQDLMVRVGRDGHGAALEKAHSRPMDFTGKPLVGFVYVAHAGIRREADLRRWVHLGLNHVLTLPAKTKGAGKRVAKTAARTRGRAGS